MNLYKKPEGKIGWEGEVLNNLLKISNTYPTLVFDGNNEYLAVLNT